MNNMKYAGILYYDETDDHVDVTAFILRDKDIGFALASVSSDQGRWETSGVASLLADGSYLAKSLTPNRMKVPAASPWDIVFRIEKVDGNLVVAGHILESGVVCNFEGELDAVVPTK